MKYVVVVEQKKIKRRGVKKGGTGSKMTKSRHTPCVSGLLKQYVNREINKIMKLKFKQAKEWLNTTQPDWSVK